MKAATLLAMSANLPATAATTTKTTKTTSMTPANTAPSAGPGQGMSPSLVVLILSMLLSSQPVTSDLYLPALPALTASFAATMAQGQTTLSAMLLAFGTSQLIWGPLSDRFGRRPVLLTGLTAYVLAGFGSTLAPSMDWLIGWRVLQGAAMGAVVMCARALVRDLFRPADGARVMSKGLSGLGIVACISAPVGGLLAEFFGWRMTLLAPTVFGLLSLALVALRFEETLSRPNPLALRPEALVRTWLTMARNPTFLAFSALSVASYAGLFTFLATSSFVLIEVLGLSKPQYGMVMFFMCLAYLIGTVVCRRLLPRFGVQNSVAIAAGLSLCSGLLMAALTWADVRSVWAVVLPFAFFMLAHGVHQPCGQSGAIGPFPQAAGTAAALNGFMSMLTAFVMGSWLGTHMDGTVRPLTYGVALWSVMLALAAWTLVRRHGHTAAEHSPSANAAH
jgi:DHA1 family bicyclomycin/chloramphenicol resistance-like MFS transporter